MTNISRSKTSSAEFKALQSELLKAISQLNTQSSHHFFNSLFTESEQIMIIKRFSAIVMFKQGYSAYKVWNTLHISPTTAQKLSLAFESGAYDNLLESLTKAELPVLFTFIDKLIKAQGKDRWIFLN